IPHSSPVNTYTPTCLDRASFDQGNVILAGSFARGRIYFKNKLIQINDLSPLPIWLFACHSIQYRRPACMGEVIQNTQQEFWRPPVAEPVSLPPSVSPVLVEVCDCCETEFLPGSRFCHACGSSRTAETPFSRRAIAREARSLLSHLEFHSIERVAL